MTAHVQSTITPGAASSTHWRIFMALAFAGAMAFLLPSPAAAQVVIPGGGGSSTDEDDEKKKEKRTSSKRRRKKCSQGKKITADTDGHCCWPGQAWNGERCVGVPSSCPDDWRADTQQEICMPSSCEDGMVMVDEEHCCWDGQAWSSSKDACIGRPSSCPAGYQATSDGCVGDSDQDGLVGAADSCPTEAEDQDGFEDDDGCPDNDNDGDGIADADDECPMEAGVADADGCPGDEEAGTDAAASVADDTDTEETGMGGGSAAGPPPEPVDEGGISGMAIGGWVALGVGIAVLGGGVGMHFAAEAKRDEVRDANQSFDADGNPYYTDLDQDEAVQIQDDANTTDTIGAVLMGTGGAIVATGVVLLVVDAVGGETDEVSAGVTITPDGTAGLVLGTRF